MTNRTHTPECLARPLDVRGCICASKRIVLFSPPVTCAFGTFTVDANGQLYEMKHETEMSAQGQWQENTGRYVLSRVTFVDPKEG